MLFETGEDVLHWYDKEERVLTPAFLETIPWDKVKETPLASELAPVLRYMRDIETFTTMYADELRRTPTGKDPVVKRFMERWETEETLHGELLNRFLNEAGFVTPSDWKDQSFAAISPEYRRSAKLTTGITNLVGKNFSAVHMTWGGRFKSSRRFRDMSVCGIWQSIPCWKRFCERLCGKRRATRYFIGVWLVSVWQNRSGAKSWPSFWSTIFGRRLDKGPSLRLTRIM